MIRNYAAMVGKVKNPEYAQQGITDIKNVGKYKIFGGMGPIIVNLLNNIKTNRKALNYIASAKAADDAAKAVNDAK